MQLPVYTRTAGAPGADLDRLLHTEWLLTNDMGGFAMGTVAGVPSRRYHGLLVASLRPPVNRVMALTALAESVTTGGSGLSGGDRYDLSNFRFQPGVIHPEGYRHLAGFRKDVSCRWTYHAGPIGVYKTVHLLLDQPAVIVQYQVENPEAAPATLSLRPLVAMRDFHALVLRELARDKIKVETTARGLAVTAQGVGTLAMEVTAGSIHMPLSRDEHWWHNFQYDVERDRGYDYLEDLFNPGSFEIPCPHGLTVVTLKASLGSIPGISLAEAEAQRRQRLTSILDATRVTLGSAFGPMGPLKDHIVLKHLPPLVQAADDFVIKRVRPGALAGAPADRVSIIAGYPWFADWGRDSMISLPGLLLTTGRFAEAREVLRTFAGACKDGLIPNVFDDYSGQAHYNTVDASLWFLQAACRFLDESGDASFFQQVLLPACTEIVARYQEGTHFGIRADAADGLICAGDETTQLTWMDAKRDGVVFTPRHGKPVEINALWYNGLRSLAALSGDAGPVGRAQAETWSAMADKVARSFVAKFWNEQRRCLYDCLAPGPGGTEMPAPEVRPNQIFAVSLPYSPLTGEQQRAVVAVVKERLYTPHGLRTLEPGDWRYKGRFRGKMFDRDAAYHNGTAWPWLLGAYAEAVLRAGGFTIESVREARKALAPLMESLDSDCCGQIAEVYDSDDTPDEPARSGACPAQAWSVAELLRVKVMIARCEAKLQ